MKIDKKIIKEVVDNKNSFKNLKKLINKYRNFNGYNIERQYIVNISNNFNPVKINFVCCLINIFWARYSYPNYSKANLKQLYYLGKL